jgi:hypothetical protein
VDDWIALWKKEVPGPRGLQQPKRRDNHPFGGILEVVAAKDTPASISRAVKRFERRSIELRPQSKAVLIDLP